jgi:hypothetical protein
MAIESLAEKSIDLKGPVIPVTKEKTEKDLGFKIDIESQNVICPAGTESKKFHILPSGKVDASFLKNVCNICNRKDVCKPQPRGKIYSQRPVNKFLSDRRELMKSDEYQKDLHLRNGIEGTLSGLVRGQKIRRLKFKGKLKGRFK